MGISSCPSFCFAVSGGLKFEGCALGSYAVYNRKVRVIGWIADGLQQGGRGLGLGFRLDA